MMEPDEQDTLRLAALGVADDRCVRCHHFACVCFENVDVDAVIAQINEQSDAHYRYTV